MFIVSVNCMFVKTSGTQDIVLRSGEDLKKMLLFLFGYLLKISVSDSVSWRVVFQRRAGQPAGW